MAKRGQRKAWIWVGYSSIEQSLEVQSVWWSDITLGHTRLLKAVIFLLL